MYSPIIINMLSIKITQSLLNKIFTNKIRIYKPKQNRTSEMSNIKEDRIEVDNKYNIYIYIYSKGRMGLG